MSEAITPSAEDITIDGCSFPYRKTCASCEMEMAVSGEADEPPPRQVTPQQLKEILADHGRWLASHGREGAKADLQRTDLHGLDLRGANLRMANLRAAILIGAKLQRADLSWAELQDARLYGADLRGALLDNATLDGANLVAARLWHARVSASLKHVIAERADFHGADLDQANLQEAFLAGACFNAATLRGAVVQKATLAWADFRGANVADAYLSDATGLTAEQLAGADVAGAKLPAAIKTFEGLGHIEHSTVKGSRLLIAMLLACVYSLLTIATTTDARLLTNSFSSPLPGLPGADIPIVYFYLAAPLLLFGTYLYFNISLQRHWEALAVLPAVFPDGRCLDEKVEPWLVNGLVSAHVPRLLRRRPPLWRVQAAISRLLIWRAVPLVMLVFLVRYLVRHDWLITLVQVFLLTTSAALALRFERLAGATLRGHAIGDHQGQEASRLARIWAALGSGIRLPVSLIFVLALALAYNGIERERWTADLSEAQISMKPEGWTGREISLVTGATLRDQDLRGANATAAFLVRADLRGSDLRRANLRRADMRAANLQDVDLREAELRGAQLSGANLRRADLRKAYLQGANLEGAILNHANLSGAWLAGYNTSSPSRGGLAGFDDAALERAKLTWADLTREDLQADLAPLTDLLVGANLRGADLRVADLRGAHLQGVDLTGADLLAARLEGADLRGADLRNTKGLTEEQIRSAVIDATMRPPAALSPSLP